jgi:predicted Fe-Mo cluster-binding NifX family protein
MKRIAFACEDNTGLESQVSAHFGRCPYYTVVEVEGNEIVESEVLENPYFNNHQPGAVPNFIRSQNVHVMIAGGMGPRAIDLFNQFGIDVATGVQGQVKSVTAAYLDGRVSGTSACEHHDHGANSCGHHDH